MSKDPLQFSSPSQQNPTGTSPRWGESYLIKILPCSTLRTEQMGKSASVQSQVTASEGKCLFYLVLLFDELEAEFPYWLPNLAQLVELKV